MSIRTSNLDYKTIEVEGVDTRDYPDFVDAYVVYAEWVNGYPLTEEELDQLNEEHSGLVQECALQSLI